MRFLSALLSAAWDYSVSFWAKFKMESSEKKQITSVAVHCLNCDTLLYLRTSWDKVTCDCESEEKQVSLLGTKTGFILKEGQLSDFCLEKDMKLYVEAQYEAELKEDCDCGYNKFGKVREYSKNKDQVLKP